MNVKIASKASLKALRFDSKSIESNPTGVAARGVSRQCEVEPPRAISQLRNGMGERGLASRFVGGAFHWKEEDAYHKGVREVFVNHPNFVAEFV